MGSVGHAATILASSGGRVCGSAAPVAAPAESTSPLSLVELILTESERRFPNPAPRVLPALVIASTRRVPSLSGVTPRTPPQYVPPSGGHSFRAGSARFPGAERRSSPVPACGRCSLFGIDSRRIHRQALSGLSWLSYSPPPDLPKVVGGLAPESACRQVGRSPRRPRLNGLSKTGPPGRDYATVSSPHPLRPMTALIAQGASASPAFVAGLTIGSNRQITRVVGSGVTIAGLPLTSDY